MYVIYMWNLKKKTSEYNKKQTHRYREQTSGYQWREGRREEQDRSGRLRGTNYKLLSIK